MKVVIDQSKFGFLLTESVAKIISEIKEFDSIGYFTKFSHETDEDYIKRKILLGIKGFSCFGYFENYISKKKDYFYTYSMNYSVEKLNEFRSDEKVVEVFEKGNADFVIGEVSKFSQFKVIDIPVEKMSKWVIKKDADGQEYIEGEDKDGNLSIYN